MTLSINNTFNIITIVSDKLDSFISSPSSYLGVDVTFTTNCKTKIVKSYTYSSPITNSGDIRTSGGIETIYPSILGMTSFPNSIIGIEVKLTTLSGSASFDNGCLFVDNGDIFCAIDKDCQDKLMYYYTLEKSQNCSCNCTNLCELLTAIQDSTSTHDCNC